jgi:hypothetical protein
MDSPWGPHCETTVTVDERAQGKIRNACRTGAGPVALKEWTLRSADVDRLRRLVRQADLFGKVSEGHDARGIDLALVTLRAAAEGQTVEVICLVNPDFRSAGPRKDLLDQLMSWQGETGTPGVTDVGAAEPDNGAAEARKESVQ